MMAITAQILIHNQLTWIGALMYAASAAGLFIWIYNNPKWRHVFANQFQLNQTGEKILLGLIIFLAIYTRFRDLNSRVYGLDLNETKWTVQSWYSAILRADVGELASIIFF